MNGFDTDVAKSSKEQKKKKKKKEYDSTYVNSNKSTKNGTDSIGKEPT